MSLVQLDPVLPVRVVGGAGWDGPTGPAVCLAWDQVSAEHDLVWVCAFDATGEVWEVRNPFVRLRTNMTHGRRPPAGPAG